MRANQIRRALCVMLLLSPGAAFSLGLGDIKLHSALNAPLDADIELVGAAPEEIASLKATLASRDTFARYGLDYPSFLSHVSLSKAKSAAGLDVLKVKSQESVTEPFVTLLVDVNWGRGRLVREYTLLLDPPVFTPGAAQVAQIAPPATAATRAGPIQREAPAAAPSTAPSTSPYTSPAPPPATSTAEAGAAQSYSVQRGDTLSAIAVRLAAQVGGASRDQMMMALYRGNPDAFEGSMNDLHSGAILRVPTADSLSSISSQAAATETRRQYSAWRARVSGSGSAGAGRLRLVAPSENGRGAGAASQDVKGLRDRVSLLEGELTESRRLLELKNAELADLQRRLRGGTGTAEPAAPTPATPKTPSLANTPKGTPAPAAAPVSEAPIPAAATPATPPAMAPETAAGQSAQAPAANPAASAATPANPAAPPPAASPPKTPRVLEQPTAEEPSFISSLWASVGSLVRDYWLVLVALLLGLLGFLGLRKFQAQRAESDAQLQPRYEMSEPPPPPPAPPARVVADDRAVASSASADTARLRRPDFSGAPEKGMLVEESGEREQPKPAAGTAQRGEDSLSGETGINLDHSDPLAEADFHMAYGLYDQAADLVRGAIKREPDRRDLKLKLVEVFFVWGNRTEFLTTARDLFQTRSQAASGEWEKIAIMGRQIAPDDALFAGAPAPGSGGDAEIGRAHV